MSTFQTDTTFSSYSDYVNHVLSTRESELNNQRKDSSLSPISFDGGDLSAEHIPDPTGWRLVIAPIHVQEKTQGGIIITHTDQKLAEAVRFVGKVIGVGPLCYKHDKFKEHPNQKPTPWCKLGDIVTTSQYAGTQIPMINDSGEEYYLRVVNDDEILTVISNTNYLNI